MHIGVRTCPEFLRHSARPRLEPMTSGRKSDALPWRNDATYNNFYYNTKKEQQQQQFQQQLMLQLLLVET